MLELQADASYKHPAKTHPFRQMSSFRLATGPISLLPQTDLSRHLSPVVSDVGTDQGLVGWLILLVHCGNKPMGMSVRRYLD